MSFFYDTHGNLPEGIHQLSLDQVRFEFGQSNSRREWLMQRLDLLITTARDSDKLKRVFLWGSFASLKPFPNDIDILLVFCSDFSDEDLTGELMSILDHEQAKLRYQADVFWIRENLAPEIFNLFLETYQKDREQKRRGIVEVLL